MNTTRVIPARLFATKASTGGKVEILLLRQLDDTRWHVLAGGRKVFSGLELHFASNGQRALEAARDADFALILMDVQMPEMDGLEASRRITSRYGPHERPRIVAMTANAMQGDREQCLAAGMDDYLTKPIRVDTLVEALGRTEARDDA